MKKILDLIRENVFWAAIAAVVLALAVVYLVVARGMAREVEDLNRRSKENIADLRRLAGERSIPNRTMVVAANQEQQRFQTYYGQLFLVYANRSGILDGEFLPITDFGPTEESAWWREYESRTQGLLARLRETWPDAPADVLLFARFPGVQTKDVALARQRQREFWTLKCVVDALLAANPRDARLAENVMSIRVAQTPPHLRHPWLRAIPVSLYLGTHHRDLGRLMAALENGPVPLMVTACTVVRPGGGGVAGPGPVLAPETGSQIMVTVSCELVEFRPAVQSVGFSGPLFADPAAVKAWLQREEADLTAVVQHLAERIPALKARLALVPGQHGGEARLLAERAFAEELRRIDEDAPRVRAELLDKAKGPDGTVAPEREKEVAQRCAELVAQKKKEARDRFEQAVQKVALRGSAFALVYEHLYPLVPERAYFVGSGPDDRRFLIVRVPSSATHRPRSWWLAQEEGGAAKTRAQMDEELRRSRQVPVPVVEGPQDNVSLLADARTGQVLQVRVPDGAGGWRTYPVVKAGERAVSLSDTAFRFAPVVGAAAAAADRIMPGTDGLMISFLAPDALQGPARDIDIEVKEGSEGRIRAKAGLRK